MRDNKALGRLRQDEVRKMVRSYFTASLDRYIERLNDTGLPDRSLDLLRQELAAHEDASDDEGDLSDLYLDGDAFRASVGLSDAQWAENAPSLHREMRKGRRDMLRAVLEAAERLERYSYGETAAAPLAPPAPALPASASLGQAVEDFMGEHSRQWPEKTAKQV
jgi:hypothetical protein